MTTKSLLIVGALSLASLGIASAKSYDIMLSTRPWWGIPCCNPVNTN